MNEVWSSYRGDDLRQGDILADCAIAIIPDEFSAETQEDELLVETRRLIVVTQSCDLANCKAPYVALCPVQRLDEIEKAHADVFNLALIAADKKIIADAKRLLPQDQHARKQIVQNVLGGKTDDERSEAETGDQIAEPKCRNDDGQRRENAEHDDEHDDQTAE